MNKKKFTIDFFINRFFEHYRKVQNNMILLDLNRNKLPFKIRKFSLIKRSFYHDIDKFEKNKINAYVKMAERHFLKKNNLPYDFINMDEINKVRKLHYISQRHHIDGKTKMSNIDICEMCCDISAIAWEVGETDYTEYYREKIQSIPLVQKYNKNILTILLLLQELNKDNLIK